MVLLQVEKWYRFSERNVEEQSSTIKANHLLTLTQLIGLGCQIIISPKKKFTPLGFKKF